MLLQSAKQLNVECGREWKEGENKMVPFGGTNILALR